ncbi:MAG: hypothetical protein KUL82_07135 [Bdellovibrio sp.]|nr:hypothetical protein [Bdellovibrio sp.]
MRNALALATLFTALICSTAFADNVLQNIQTSAALDFVAPFHFEESEQNKLELRAAELFFFGPLDSTFDGTLNVAAHNENGEFILEAQEGYISSHKLIPSSHFKIGKFFLGVGLLNQFHQHDWSFISGPRVQTEFFDKEAVVDSGGEFTTAVPLSSHWEITGGVTNGYTYGHAHDAGEKPRVPTHYLHSVSKVDFGETGNLQWGANYLGRTDAYGVQTQLYGFDFLFKKTEAQTPSVLLQSEIWYRNLSAPGTSAREDVGAYFFPQVSLSEHLSAGMRIDLFWELSRTFENSGDRQDNLNYALVPTLTYKHSEFTLFRAAYTYDMQTYKGEADRLNQSIELQIVALLGELWHSEHH